MFHVYILKLINGKFYVGQTGDINKRLDYHNNGWSKYTKAYRPVNLVYSEEFACRSDALKRERYLKTLKSHLALENIVHSAE